MNEIKAKQDKPLRTYFFSCSSVQLNFSHSGQPNYAVNLTD